MFIRRCSAHPQRAMVNLPVAKFEVSIDIIKTKLCHIFEPPLKLTPLAVYTHNLIWTAIITAFAVRCLRIEFCRTHEITLTFTVDQLDPTLPCSQRLSFRYFRSEECDNVSEPAYVRKPSVSQFLRENNASLLGRTEEPHIVVLGGGITGLSSAYHLARKFPTTKITLVEGSNRIGGWLNSERVHVGSGTMLLEKGPRTLRSSSKAVLEVVSVY